MNDTRHVETHFTAGETVFTAGETVRDISIGQSKIYW